MLVESTGWGEAVIPAPEGQTLTRLGALAPGSDGMASVVGQLQRCSNSGDF